MQVSIAIQRYDIKFPLSLYCIYGSVCLCLHKGQKTGIPVVVDAGTLRDGMLEIAKMSDCFIASEIFSKALTADPEETCRNLSDLGCPFVGVTLGTKGYIALVNGRYVHSVFSPVTCGVSSGGPAIPLLIFPRTDKK